MTLPTKAKFHNVAARCYEGRPMVLLSIAIGDKKPIDLLVPASEAQRLVMRIACAHEIAVDMVDT